MNSKSINYSKALSEIVCKALRSAVNRKETDLEVKEVQAKLNSSLKSLEHRLAFNNYITLEQIPHELDLLKKYFYLEIIEPTSEQRNIVPPKVAVFRDLIPHLTRYISKSNLRRIDPSSYKETLEHSAFFDALDSKIRREGTTWTLDIKKDKKSDKKREQQLEIRPLRFFDEFYQFMKPESRYCFFDHTRNIAQLYLYAAHRQTRMLGIWDKESKKTLGLIPMFIMQQNDDDLLDGCNEEPISWLSVEFPLLEEPINGEEMLYKSSVRLTNKKTVPFYDALLDIILVYSLLEEEEPIPFVGSCRKDDNKLYCNIFRKLTSRAARRFELPWYHFRNNKLRIEEYERGGKNRTRTAVKDCLNLSLELPEDKQLLTYIKEHMKEPHYRFDKIFMFTQSFLKDEKRAGGCLYNDWGEMRGVTPAIPLKEYFRIKAEQETGENARI